MKKIPLLLICALFVCVQAFGQSTIITPGDTQPNITATSTLNGVVFPRMTTAQKNAITSLSAGTIVFDTDLKCLSLYTGNDWVCMNSPSSSLGPTFQNFQLTMNPSGNAPLTGIITVTSNQPIKLSYTVKGQDGEDFTLSNDKFSADNDTTINLFALYPSFTNTVIVTITSQTGYITQRTIYVPTDAIPVDMPQSNEIIVNARNSNILTKFIMCFPIRTQGLGGVVGAGGYPTMVDTFGKIRWYLTVPLESTTTLLPLKNGRWLLSFHDNFKEVDLLGNISRTILTPSTFIPHHDVIQLPNENLVYLGESSLNNTVEDKVYTMNFNTGLLTADSLNLYTILDPARPQLPFVAPNDWFHANSITYDAIDNTFIISGRDQSSVVKIDATTKQLKWILSDPTGWNGTLSPYLLNPSGINFEQQWGQHSAILKPGDNHTILLFDNGNVRSYTNPIAPTNNYSRAVEYTINETNKTVVQNFDFGKSYGSTLFAPYVGSVNYINNDRVFIDYGGIVKDINNNAVELSPNVRNQVRLFEVDKNQNVYLDISIKNPNTSDPLLRGFRSYRAYNFNFK